VIARTATALGRLAALLNALPPRDPSAPDPYHRQTAYADQCGLPVKRGQIALDDLPTFGGDAPSDVDGVWSWDATHLLVCVGSGLGRPNALGNAPVSSPWRVVER